MSMLLLCILWTITTVVYTQGGGADFLSLESIRNKSVLLYEREEYYNQTRLYPQLNFTCNGTINSIMFLSRKCDVQSNATQAPLQFSLWKTMDHSTWNREGYVQPNSSIECEDTVCLMAINNASLKFQAGFQFSAHFIRESSCGLIHQEGGGVSLVLPRGSRFNESTLDFTSGTMSEAFPLLAIETDRQECVHGFLPTEALLQSTKVLNLEQEVEDMNTVEFMPQCSCPVVSSLLFAGSFKPHTTIDLLNLNITFEVNQGDRKRLTGQTVKMTSKINVFQYQIPGSITWNLSTNIVGQISIENGINMYLIKNGTALITPNCCGDNTDLIRTSLFIDNIEEPISDDRQLLFPNITFKGPYNITSWTFTARRNFSKADDQSYIEFQVWFPNINCAANERVEYEKVGRNTISMSDVKPTDFPNVFEYKVPSAEQIRVAPGDVFGVFQSEGESLSMVFVEDVGYLAYESHAGVEREGLVEFTSTGDYLFPLVTFNSVESDNPPNRAVNDCDTDVEIFRLALIFATILFVLLFLVLAVLVLLLIHSRKQAKRKLTNNTSMPGNHYVNEPVLAGYETIAPPLPSRNGPRYESIEMYNPHSSDADKNDSAAEYTYVRAEAENPLIVTFQTRNGVSESNTGENSTSAGDHFKNYSSLDLAIYVPTLKQRADANAKVVVSAIPPGEDETVKANQSAADTDIVTDDSTDDSTAHIYATLEEASSQEANYNVQGLATEDFKCLQQ